MAALEGYSTGGAGEKSQKGCRFRVVGQFEILPRRTSKGINHANTIKPTPDFCPLRLLALPGGPPYRMWPIVHRTSVTPRPQRRYPYRSMTLCIAASAGADRIDLFSDNRIVLAFDRKIGSEYASAEIGHKMEWLNHGWAALYAGDVSIAQELIGIYTEHLAHVPTHGLSEDAALESLRQPPLALKRRRGENYVQSSFGITYADLLEPGRVQVPDDQRQQILNDISTTYQRVNCQLIIAGFINDRPKLFVFDGLQPNGPSEFIKGEHFVAIGTGAGIAEANLFQRKHESRVPLGVALYHVYESKRLGQIASGVGEETMMVVLEPNGDSVKALHVTESGLEFLDKQFKKFGPRRPTIPTLPEAFFV